MTINSKNILYGKGKNDECYTPSYAVTPLLKYIPKNRIIWCPFDKQESEFPKQISKKNKVIYSHIDNGQDFYEYEPENFDIILSNPPFTNKKLIFERALSFNKPFALLAPMTWFNDNALSLLFREKDLQILGFDKRIKFSNQGIINNKITFASAYLCWNFLPKQIIFEELKIKV